jgi:ABC-2 type transport system ATP-binding protein
VTAPVPSVLRLRGVSRAFSGRPAVDGADLDVAKGEILGFLGPNGAGKTTLMSLVMGLVQPDRGEIELFGVPRGARQRALRLRLGYLQEKPRIWPEMTARAYLGLFARLYGVPRPALRTAEVLETVGLAAAADRPLGTFSRGMQQRAVLGRVILHRPDLLLLDEPTLGLDPTGVAEMRTVLLGLRAAGATLVFSSHQLAEMERICDRVAVMKAGRILAVGSPAELLPDGRSDLLVVETAEPVAAWAGALRAQPGIREVRPRATRLAEVLAEPGALGTASEARAALSRRVTGLGQTVLSVAAAAPSLEDVFLALAGSARAAQ